ncbi:MAG: neuromedin U [Gammaproteobacteria bacterium]|nr:neuromedin U [Gammaproteobacteria bacterium]
MKLSLRIKLILLIATFLSTYNISYAQSNSELAKEAQNPVANLISLPFQNNINTGIGPDDETQNILNVQPVWPVSLNDDWNLITRTIVPVVSQPDVLTGEGRVNGLGDTTFTAFLSPSNSGSLTWGVGPVFLLPTATDDKLGSDKWGAGASVVLLAMPGNWVIGSLFSNVWSVGGSGNQDINLFTWQYFINYNLPKSWYLTSAPIITANWEANSKNRWTVPIGGGVGKIFRIGKQPFNAQVSAYNNIEAPEFGADWQFRLQLQLLFPK